MKKYTLLIIPLLVGLLLTTRSGWCRGNSSDTSAVLKIGDKVPDSIILHILNYPKDHLRLTDFNDRLLILDFWAPYCSPCLRALPKFQELQRKFGDKVQFLLVTSEKPDYAQKSLKAHQVTLPSVSQSTLHRNFHVNYIPHEVWIKNGIVLAETQPWVVNEENLEKVISGSLTNLPSKIASAKFDHTKPFLVDGNGGDGDNLLFHSVLTGYSSGFASVRIHGQDDSHRINRITVVNGGIKVLYQAAWELFNPEFAYDNRVEIDVRDSLKPYFYKPSEMDEMEMMASYGFCYEIIDAPDALLTKMLDDLNRYFESRFGIRAELQKRLAPCWVISPLKEAPVVQSSGGQPFYHSDDKGYQIRNLPFKQFFSDLLAVHGDGLPIVDRSGFRGNIDLNVFGKFNDLASLKRALNTIGLDISREDTTIDMLVIIDRPNHNLTDKPKP